MAFTLNNFWGYETQGHEEMTVTAGTAEFETGGQQRTDAAAVKSASINWELHPFKFISDAGDRQCFGFGFLVPNFFTDSRIFLAQEGGVATWELRLGGVDGKFFRLLQQGGSQIGLGTTQLVLDQQYFIEIVWQHSTSGEIELFIDGVSEITATGADLSDGGTFDNYWFNNSSQPYFDDVYAASGLTGVGDRLSATKAAPYFEVYGYQPTKASAVPDAGLDGNAGSNLDTGNWDDAGETPANDTNTAQYTGDGALYGTVDLPSFGDEIDSDDAIIGIRGIWRLKKGATGAATVHKTGLGDSGDGNNAANVTRTLTTAYDIYETLRTTNLPTKAQNIRMGFSTDGEQDIICGEMWAMIAHAPPLSVAPSATAAQTLPSLAQAGVGGQEFTAIGGQLLGNIAQSAVGSERFIATADQILPLLAQSAVGSERFTATGGQLLAALAQVGLGGQGFTAIAAQLLTTLAQTGTGVMQPSGVGAQLLLSLLQAGVGEHILGTVGDGAQLFANLAQAGVGAEVFIGLGSQVLPLLLQTASGGMQPSGIGASLLLQLLQSGSGVTTTPGIGAQTLLALLQTGVGAEVFNSIGDQTFELLGQSGVGLLRPAGFGAQMLPLLVQTGSGFQTISGVGFQVLESLLQAGVATGQIDGVGNQVLEFLAQAGIAVHGVLIVPVDPFGIFEAIIIGELEVTNRSGIKEARII